MLLWTGLGNPEPGMSRNRHNVGFMAVDRIAGRTGFPRGAGASVGRWPKAWSGGTRCCCSSP